MKRLMIGSAISVTAALLFVASTKTVPVTVKGSDTMVILSQRWAEAYMKNNPGQVIQVTGGGSGTGFAALINGTTTICNASRPIKPKEVSTLREKFGGSPVEIRCAIDGIAIFVHESNPLEEITLAQIKAIYTGEVTNWKALGGSDAAIVVYGRENNSGTYEFFREHVLDNADYALKVQSMPGTAAVVNAVVKDRNGIGYGGAAYGKGIKELRVKKDAASTAVAPEMDAIRSGSYPISRFLYMYTIRRPEGAVKSFIDFALSEEGQKVVSEVGYYPLR